MSHICRTGSDSFADDTAMPDLSVLADIGLFSICIISHNFDYAKL